MTDGAGPSVAIHHVVIDGWAHCGIRRFRPIEEVLSFLEAVGIDQAVIVQPLRDDDNEYLLEVAAAHRDRVRCIGVVAADSPNRAATLDRLAVAGAAGVRITSSDLIANPKFAAEAAAAGLVVAIHAPDGVATLAPMAGLLGSLETRVVVAHLGMPTVVDGRLDRGSEITMLAGAPNVHVLLSGLALATPYPYGPLVGLVREVVGAFGPDRILWGSNYPLAEAPEAVRDLALITSSTFGLTMDDISAITATTARRLWFEWPYR